jgi:glycosyltransferase involved in cell wall biosynthesis
MRILLLFGLFPEHQKANIIANSRGVIQYAADALQQAIVNGLAQLHNEVDIINMPAIGSFPNRYKTMFYPGSFFEHTSGIKGIDIGFCNLSIYKLYSRYKNVKKALQKWVQQFPGEKFVLISGIQISLLMAAIEVKKRNHDMQVGLIVSDLPQYMDMSASFIKSFLKKVEIKILTHIYKYVDSYVLLSKYMAEKLPVGKKNWVVMEGIFDNKCELFVNNGIKQTKKQILYSGTLAKKYGVMNLVYAFSQLTDNDIELLICGDGDARSEIVKKAKNDPRIIYRGQLPREEVLKLQRSALLLVNPRTPEGEFTKYSFPSKTMEYFASGTPTLMYRLKGIPDEYYNHCFIIEDISIDALKNKLKEIINMNEDILRIKGINARNFILNEKNPEKQCMKIINLLKNKK